MVLSVTRREGQRESRLSDLSPGPEHENQTQTPAEKRPRLQRAEDAVLMGGCTAFVGGGRGARRPARSRDTVLMGGGCALWGSGRVQGALPGAGDAVLMGECTAFCWGGGGCRVPCQEIRRSLTPGLSPQQSFDPAPKRCHASWMVLCPTSAHS